MPFFHPCGVLRMTTPIRLVRPGGHAPERDPDAFEHDNPLPDVWEGRLRQEEQSAPPSLRSGLLRREIDAACADGGFNLADLTVLSDKLDPYRRDTNAGHRDGQWFAGQVARF